jgi:hypothetical protein
MYKRRGASRLKRLSILINLLYPIYIQRKAGIIIGKHRVPRRLANTGELRGIATFGNAALAERAVSFATASATEVHV